MSTPSDVRPPVAEPQDSSRPSSAGGPTSTVTEVESSHQSLEPDEELFRDELMQLTMRALRLLP